MRTFCNKKAISMLFILSLLLFPAVSIAEFVGSFSRLEGRVDLLRSGATSVVPVRQGDGVSMGDVIRTKSDGKAEILFKDDTTLTVAPETRLKIDEYTFNADKSRNKGRLSLLRGKVRAAVSKVKGGLIPVSLGSSTFSINTPTTVAGVRGTVFFIFFDKGVTGVVFKEGNGFVYNQNMPDKIVNVSAGQATFILKDDTPPLPPRPVSDVEMMQYIKDTTIDGSQTTNDNADTGVSLDQAGGGDVLDYNAPKTADIGVDPGPPPPVLPITETNIGILKETVPPLITITSSPQAITNSSSGSFTVTANEPVTFTYSMGSWGVTTTLTTSDTITLAGLPEGSHTLTITATDAAGNVSTSSYSWTTDYTAPVTTFTSSPATLTNISTANFGVSSSETSTYSYKLDGTTVASTNLTAITEGPHTFTVTATDAAGNISTTSYSWITDYTAPVAILTPAASPESGDLATIKVNLSSNESSTYLYKLDGGSLTSTGATLTLSGISEGSHTVELQATDVVGNVSTTTLAFYLSRYSLSGNFWGCIGNVTGSVSGEVAGVSGKNWGGWNMTMNGTGNLTPNPTWTLFAGGTSTDATYADGRNNGYWIEVAPGSSNFGNQTLSGTSTFKYLSYDRMGIGTGVLTGTYDGLGGYSLIDSGTGTYTETPLAWSGDIDYDYNDNGLYNNGDGILGMGDTYGGLVGGTQSPWSGTTPLTLMGSYWGPLSTDIGPFMWNAPIYSYNKNGLTRTTYDGGAFWGLTGGTWWDSDNVSTTAGDRNIDARIYSLYIDPSGNAGILKGTLTGEYYPELRMFSADGTWTPTVLATGLNPTLLSSDSMITYNPDIYFSSLTSGAGVFSAGGLIYGGNALGTKYSMTGQDWGIWQILAAGGYSETSSDIWDMSLGYADSITIIGTETQGTQWSSQRLAGATLGYGADITTTPMTWISVGETIGTFDANNLTWQAVQTGAWLDTNRFLVMTQTAGGQAKLAQLNIPFVEVGRANLTDQGTGTIGGSPATVNMNNVIFFAYSNGAAPKIWATGDVQGTYTCSACGGGTIPVAGNGLSANFNVQTFDTAGQKWIATVDGSGTYSGTGTMSGSSVVFGGAAAGTNSGGIGGTFTGTGAGVAK